MLTKFQITPMQSELELFKDMLTGAVYDESAWTPVLNETLSPTASLPGRLKHYVLSGLAKRLNRSGITMLRRQDYLAEQRENGLDWPLVGYSMIGRKRLDHLQVCAETVLAERIPGDFIETGVWRGGSCMLIKKILNLNSAQDRTVWLADSFQGLPAPKNERDGFDLTHVSMLAVSADQVRKNFERFGLLDERVRFLEGWFADTLPTAPLSKLALLRLDGDMYHSTMDALVHLYDRVSPGGFVIIDDYHSWESCRRAVHDFFATRTDQPNPEPIDSSSVFWRVGSN